MLSYLSSRPLVSGWSLDSLKMSNLLVSVKETSESADASPEEHIDYNSSNDVTHDAVFVGLVAVLAVVFIAVLLVLV